ncbi:MAG: ATP-binding cassette domain-containing protein, partial [Bacteroidia bacterium]|nr:ATP-binding cassette domain-containing protein [Bacteroidia bacterium]
YQDAKIALERITDITAKDDEDPVNISLMRDIPSCESIQIKDLTFYYGTEKVEPVIKDFNLTIEAGKTTAIVGPSGSGKTTLLKLLLKFYNANKGSIELGSIDFKNLHHGSWRDRCGAVLQDGILLNGTIADNIALGQKKEHDRIVQAAKTTCIYDFINALPQGFETEIGLEGLPVSTGQKQRILLARAVYKDPDYILLDEATSSLDAENERMIIENLNELFEDKTVVVVAHRLSTVKNADNIIVMDNGCISESGTHDELVAREGVYFQLIKNQLELGG